MISLSSVLIAFVGGVVSFISPCVIPLIPGYLSFLSGMSVEELSKNSKTTAILYPALMFIAGFTLVFVSLGAGASILGSFFRENVRTFAIIGGVIITLLGIYMLEIIKIPALYSSFNFDLSKSRRFGRFAAFFVGMGFAAGWTPCIGPILASILALASSAGSAQAGIFLLLSYSAGLAIPFLLVAVLFSRLKPLIGFISRHSLIINRIAGVILILVGITILTNKFSVIVFFITKYIPGIEVTLPELY